MASRAAVQRLRHEAMTSGKWRSLQFRERCVWLVLSAEALEAPVPGRIMFDRPLIEGLSDLLALPHVEAAAAVAVLCSHELLIRDPSPDALWLPGIIAAAGSSRGEGGG